MRLFLFSFLCLAACTAHEPKKPAVAEQKPVFGTPLNLNYDSCKQAISFIKTAGRKSWAHFSATEKERFFTNAVTKTIIPAWIGTSWDFYGTTETPQKGKIACGYFVTTVLRDAGLPLARIKLAQCASEEMIRTLVAKQHIQCFSNVPMNDFINTIKAGGYGLYIIGLDNHTGFIFRDSDDIRFIHSTFLGTRNVQNEAAAGSPIIAASKYRVIGKISADEASLKRWVEK